MIHVTLQNYKNFRSLLDTPFAVPTQPPISVAIGDLSMHGFDKTGTETFWTVTEGNNGAMAVLDVNGDGATDY